jgi:hypothetical protein
MNPETFAHRLIDVATNFVGLYETVSNAAFNDPARSKVLLKAMKRVPWWAPGAAYCAAFDGAVVILAAEGLGLDPSGFLKRWTAHCMTNAKAMRDLGLLSAEPAPGALWLARHGNSDSGHAGIVIDSQGQNMANVEGNTSAGATASAELQRNGDGIYGRLRNQKSNGALKTVGFVHPASILSLMGIGTGDHVNTSPSPQPKTPERSVVRVQEYLESIGHAKLVPKAVKQSFAKYDPNLGYSVAVAADISNWLVKQI